MATTKQELVLRETNGLPNLVELEVHSNWLPSLPQCFRVACSSCMVSLHVQKVQYARKALKLHRAL